MLLEIVLYNLNFKQKANVEDILLIHTGKKILFLMLMFPIKPINGNHTGKKRFLVLNLFKVSLGHFTTKHCSNINNNNILMNKFLKNN